jgi:hypothetical protein
MEGWVVCEDAYGHLSQRALCVTVHVRVLLPRNTNLKCSMEHVFRQRSYDSASEYFGLCGRNSFQSVAFDIKPQPRRTAANTEPRHRGPTSRNSVFVHSTKTAFYRNLLFL